MGESEPKKTSTGREDSRNPPMQVSATKPKEEEIAPANKSSNGR